MNLFKVNKNLYVNISHISFIGVDARCNKWYLSVIGDDEICYLTVEEKNRLIRYINEQPKTFNDCEQSYLQSAT